MKTLTVTLAVACAILLYLFLSKTQEVSTVLEDSLKTKKEVKYWKDKFGNEHATVEKIIIHNDKLMDIKSDSIAKLLSVKPKNIKSFTKFTTETKTPPIYIHDTLYKDPYIDIRIVRDSIRMTLFDTLTKTDYSKRKNIFSKKRNYTDISNTNKYVKIKEPITIERAPSKSPKIIIGPSLTWNPFNNTYSPGISILFYPLTLKL